MVEIKSATTTGMVIMALCEFARRSEFMGAIFLSTSRFYATFLTQCLGFSIIFTKQPAAVATTQVF